MAPNSGGSRRRIRASFTCSGRCAAARQRGAAVEHRAHIGGVVLHPEAQHMQQVGMIKARQQPRLLNKAVQSGMKRLAEALTAQHQIQVVAAYRQRSRHEFFNGDGAFQLMIRAR